MSKLTECASCGAAVPDGSYCAVCGHALPQPAAEPEAVDAGVTVTPAASPAASGFMFPRVQHQSVAQPGPVTAIPTWRARLENGSNRYKAGAAVLLILAAGFFVFGRGESHTITGDLTLLDSDVASLDIGDSCSGQGGYDDIASGAEVVVEDEAGTTLATSHLATGAYDGLGCVFDFTVRDVGKATFYRVLIGRDSRGGLRYSHDELSHQSWSVHLSLGS